MSTSTLDQHAPQQLKVVQETTPHPCFASYIVRGYVRIIRVRVKNINTRITRRKPTNLLRILLEKPYRRLLVYSRTNNEFFCLSLRQYPVGDNHNINNGMRAADGSGDTLGLQERAPSRGTLYLVNISKMFHAATRNTSSPTCLLYTSPSPRDRG